MMFAFEGDNEIAVGYRVSAVLIYLVAAFALVWFFVWLLRRMALRDAAADEARFGPVLARTRRVELAQGRVEPGWMPVGSDARSDAADVPLSSGADMMCWRVPVRRRPVRAAAGRVAVFVRAVFASMPAKPPMAVHHIPPPLEHHGADSGSAGQWRAGMRADLDRAVPPPDWPAFNRPFGTPRSSGGGQHRADPVEAAEDFDLVPADEVPVVDRAFAAAFATTARGTLRAPRVAGRGQALPAGDGPAVGRAATKWALLDTKRDELRANTPDQTMLLPTVRDGAGAGR